MDEKRRVKISGWAIRLFLRRLSVIAVLFALLPAVVAIAGAALRSSRGAFVVAAWSSGGGFPAIVALRAAAAAITASSLIAAASLWAWPAPGREWLRSGRLVLGLWGTAVTVYPGFASWIPVLGRAPWWLVAAGSAACVVVVCCVPRGAPVGARELVLIGVACISFYYTPRPVAVHVSELAGRRLQPTDVFIVGFDSVSYEDAADVLAAFTPSRGGKVVYANAWTPIASTSNAWRAALSGTYPDGNALLPGAIWPADHHAWLPRELALRGYRTVMVQDSPGTNVYTGADHVDVPHLQGWKALLEDFTWRAVFPLSTVGARWWLDALGAPVNSVARYAYDPDWFRHAALRELAERARSGPLIAAVHTCYMHAPLHLSIREAATLPKWWGRTPRELEGSGNPFTDAETAGAADVSAVRLASVRKQIRTWLGELDRSGVLGAAVVLFLSDHGPRGSWVPASRTEHVMLAAFLPEQIGSRMVRTPVSLVDIAPTLRAVLGAPSVPTDGVALPWVDVDSTRSIGRIESPTLDSVGLRLDNITADQVRRSLALNADGTFTYSKAFVDKLNATTDPAATVGGARGFITFVRHPR